MFGERPSDVARRFHPWASEGSEDDVWSMLGLGSESPVRVLERSEPLNDQRSSRFFALELNLRAPNLPLFLTFPATTMSANDDTASIIDRFRALALSEGLTKKSQQYKTRRREFIVGAVQSGFATQFGGNVSSLQSWKDICWTVGIEGAETLTSIKKCKAALKGTFVNIVDLVDAASTGCVMTIGVFYNATALGKYIRKTGKIFPKNTAKANQLLRQFLIRIG